MKPCGLTPEQGDSPHFATLAAPYETETLGGGSLDTDTLRFNAHNGSETRAHFCNIWSDLGSLEGNGNIHIADIPAKRTDFSHDYGKQSLARRAFPLQVSIGKQMPYVTERKCPEQSVTQRMHSHIPIRVRHKSIV